MHALDDRFKSNCQEKHPADSRHVREGAGREGRRGLGCPTLTAGNPGLLGDGCRSGIGQGRPAAVASAAAEPLPRPFGPHAAGYEIKTIYTLVPCPPSLEYTLVVYICLQRPGLSKPLASWESPQSLPCRLVLSIRKKLRHHLTPRGARPL